MFSVCSVVKRFLASRRNGTMSRHTALPTGEANQRESRPTKQVVRDAGAVRKSRKKLLAGEGKGM